jgi:hypothetical protein
MLGAMLSKEEVDEFMKEADVVSLPHPIKHRYSIRGGGAAKARSNTSSNVVFAFEFSRRPQPGLCRIMASYFRMETGSWTTTSL